jgi:hypothetical protein
VTPALGWLAQRNCGRHEPSGLAGLLSGDARLCRGSGIGGRPDCGEILEDALAKPTELAEMNFTGAEKSADEAVNFYAAAYNVTQSKFSDPRFEADLAMAKAIRSMALAMKQLSVGVRATYILLEDVKRSLPR